MLNSPKKRGEKKPGERNSRATEILSSPCGMFRRCLPLCRFSQIHCEITSIRICDRSFPKNSSLRKYSLKTRSVCDRVRSACVREPGVPVLTGETTFQGGESTRANAAARSVPTGAAPAARATPGGRLTSGTCARSAARSRRPRAAIAASSTAGATPSTST